MARRRVQGHPQREAVGSRVGGEHRHGQGRLEARHRAAAHRRRARHGRRPRSSSARATAGSRRSTPRTAATLVDSSTAAPASTRLPVSYMVDGKQYVAMAAAATSSSISSAATACSSSRSAQLSVTSSAAEPPGLHFSAGCHEARRRAVPPPRCSVVSRPRGGSRRTRRPAHAKSVVCSAVPRPRRQLDPAAHSRLSPVKPPATSTSSSRISRRAGEPIR